MGNKVPEYPHPPIPDDVELPPKKSPLSGGPWDGDTHTFTYEFFEPGERSYHLLYDKGIIDDLTLFSKEFPEGAIYRWTPKEKCWKYIGKPDEDSEDGFKKLLDFFGVEPDPPL